MNWTDGSLMYGLELVISSMAPKTSTFFWPENVPRKKILAQ